MQIGWWRLNPFRVSFWWIFFLCGFLALTLICKRSLKKGKFFVSDQSGQENFLQGRTFFSTCILILLCLKVDNLIGSFVEPSAMGLSFQGHVSLLWMPLFGSAGWVVWGALLWASCVLSSLLVKDQVHTRTSILQNDYSIII